MRFEGIPNQIASVNNIELMKKIFIAALGITIGLALSLAALGSLGYWWFEVRVPPPPDIKIKLDGFPDTKENEYGTKLARIRIIIENNSTSKLSITDAHLYLVACKKVVNVY